MSEKVEAIIESNLPDNMARPFNPELVKLQFDYKELLRLSSEGNKQNAALRQALSEALKLLWEVDGMNKNLSFALNRKVSAFLAAHKEGK